MRSNATIPLAIVLGGIVIALAVYTYAAQHRQPPAHGDVSLMRPIAPSDHILGNPAAPVSIVEYSDFSCQYCKGFHDTLHRIIAEENGRADWVFREYPLSKIHPEALAQAEAAECAADAGGNDGFWNMADQLFANQPADPSRFGALAAKAKLPGDAFASCMADASSTVGARIDADLRDAHQIGANGTPYTVVIPSGGAPVVIKGAYPYDQMKQIVDTAITESTQ